MSAPNFAARGSRIGAIGSALQSTDTRLTTVVDGVKGILADGSWREFTTTRGEHVAHERFADFVTMPMLKGLGVTVDLIRRVVADDPAALDMLDRELQNPVGMNQHGEGRDIVTTHPTGNSEAKALRRLRKEADAGNTEAAELRAEVLAGRLSAHGAMVRAGYRPRTVSVPVGRPESVAAALKRHMTPDQLARLVVLLVAEGGEP